MMKEMIRKVMEWCKLWNGETATAKQAGPSSDKGKKNRLRIIGKYKTVWRTTCGNTMSSVSTC